MKAVIDAAETSSLRRLKEEEKRVYGKFDTIYQVLVKKKSEMQKLKAEVELIMDKGDEFEFLEVSCGSGAVCVCVCSAHVLLNIAELIGVWTS